MEDSNCTLTEPLSLMESVSESSCDEECVIRKPKKERIWPYVFCPHCKQMVSKTTLSASRIAQWMQAIRI